MYSTVNQHVIAVEINGKYHFMNPRSRAKMRLKEETITEYLAGKSEIEVKNVKHLDKYKYKTFKVVGFRTEEVYGSSAMDRQQIASRIFE